MTDNFIRGPGGEPLYAADADLMEVPDPDELAELSYEDLSLQTPAIDQIIQDERQRIERAIRGAIRAGYDGVDINRLNPVTGLGIKKIVPWERPPPNGANGYRTERYTWDWFSDDELTTILRADRVTDVFDE